MRKTIYSVSIIICLCLVAGGTRANAQSTDSTKSKDIFEISFGQTLLFFSEKQLINIHNTEAIVIPTSAFLFFIEFRPKKKIKFPVFFNVPTSSKQFVVNNQLVSERASPTFGGGVEFECFHFNLTSKTQLGFEVGPLADFLFTTNNAIRFSPIIAGRIRIMKGDDFVMYIGSSYSIGTNTWGLLYGTGTIF